MCPIETETFPRGESAVQVVQWSTRWQASVANSSGIVVDSQCTRMGLIPMCNSPHKTMGMHHQPEPPIAEISKSLRGLHLHRPHKP
uniref:Uncharacterized protein n=1 Tax=Physcomitrium patens TaxID=3218 RepID=A0A2K1ICK4_PHYPA|nr:hypothetical protein PHYPA_030494 [Physcomitrium patens]